MNITIQHLDEQIKLDSASTFLATYLSWARKRRSYATYFPVISYRGHSCSTWPLLPSLCRLKLSVEMLKQIEGEVIQQFRDRFDLSVWTDTEVLAHARHHGAPTRLLDWSRNPLIGLWFAISDKEHDNIDGVIYQLEIPSKSEKISIGNCFKVERADNCPCKHPIHIFSSPSRIDRTHRQRSVFSVASFKGGFALRPLDELLNQEMQTPIRKFLVPPGFKSELRRLLSDLALDAYSIYGDPDSFGKALGVHFDISDLNIQQDVPTDSGDNQHSRANSPT